MNSLTLNNEITQSSNYLPLIRYRSLSGSCQFQYEAIINNQWTPVPHKVAEIVWDNYRAKQRALVKVNSLSYIVKALAKSSVELGGLDLSYAHNRALCGFFVHNTQLHINGGLSEGAERLAGFVSASPPTLLSSPPVCLAALVVSFINLLTRAVFMTTIPNEIASNKTISINQIDVINKKLLQAEAIIHLLSVNSRSELKINDNLVCDVLWATSDLVADARHILHLDKSKVVEL